MPKERETYRLQLELISERFPDNEILTYKQVTEYTGKSYRYLKRVFKDCERLDGIPRTMLAHKLS